MFQSGKTKVCREESPERNIINVFFRYDHLSKCVTPHSQLSQISSRLEGTTRRFSTILAGSTVALLTIFFLFVEPIKYFCVTWFC